MPIKFCSEVYFFQASSSLKSLKAQTRDPQLKIPPGGLVLRIFTTEKIHRSQPDLNLLTLDLEAITLPRDHRDLRSRLYYVIVNK